MSESSSKAEPIRSSVSLMLYSFRSEASVIYSVSMAGMHARNSKTDPAGCSKLRNDWMIQIPLAR
jgi:hypothetical protein